jgi:TonB family protein
MAARGAPDAAVFDAGVVLVVARTVAAAVPEPSPVLTALDTPLLVGWAAASCAVLVLLALSQQSLRRVAAAGTVRDLDGHCVCLTPGAGPAVVGGLRHATIVMPAWINDLEPRTRALAVRHEAEHLRAGDVRLLGLAVLAVAACPWNPFLWWQVRRLRDAVELDCDLRLVRAGVDVRAYGALLLEVARRASLTRMAIALAARPSLLSRRIDHMTPPRSATRGVRAIAGSVLGVLFVVIACEAPTPAIEADRTDAPPAVSLVDQPPQLVRAPMPLYPPLLREAGIEGDVVLEFLVDATGRVDSASVVVIPGGEEVHAAFERPAADAIRNALYEPAVTNGTPTAMRIRQTVSFRIGKPDQAP